MLGLLLIEAGTLTLIVLGLTLLIHSTLFTVTIQQQSMFPTLAHGDRVLAIRYWPSKWLHKGHIVLVRPFFLSDTASLPSGVPFYIKRIVAMANETYVISLDNLPTMFRSSNREIYERVQQHSWYIPPEHIFVRGDASSSADSRMWGPIPLKSVHGVILTKLPHKALLTTTQRSARQLVFPNNLSIGQPLPDLFVETSFGEKINLNNYNIGKSTNFLFVSLKFLNRQNNTLADIEAIAAKASLSGVSFIFILTTSIDDGDTLLFLKEYNSNLLILFNPCNSDGFLEVYKALSIPSYCLVNEQGLVQSIGKPTSYSVEWRVQVAIWEQNISHNNDSNYFIKGGS